MVLDANLLGAESALTYGFFRYFPLTHMAGLTEASPPHPPTTNPQTYNFEEKRVLIPWRSTDASGARKQAPLPPS